jgi:hypothetical protein
MRENNGDGFERTESPEGNIHYQVYGRYGGHHSFSADLISGHYLLRDNDGSSWRAIVHTKREADTTLKGKAEATLAGLLEAEERPDYPRSNEMMG